MLDDPIVAEVRKARQEIAAKFDNDLSAILEDARKREHLSGHKLVSFEQENESTQVVKEPRKRYGKDESLDE